MSFVRSAMIPQHLKAQEAASQLGKKRKISENSCFWDVFWRGQNVYCFLFRAGGGGVSRVAGLVVECEMQ